MRFLLRLASGICLFGALFSVGIASGWSAGRDTVSTETTTTAESTTSAETTTTTETATTSTETGPVSATITVTTTVNPTGAAVVGAAAASSKDESETTDWGWVAFGILAAVVVIGGIVWLVVRRRGPRTA